MSLPAIRAVRERFPGAEVVLLARPWVADLYAREPAIDRVIPWTFPGGMAHFGAKRRAAEKLRGERFDCAILLQNAFEAALLARMAGIPRRIGYNRDGRGLLLTDPIPVPGPGEIPRHERFYYLELLKRAGLLERYPPGDRICLAGAEAARAAGGERMRSAGLAEPVIGISPGAAYGTAKRWLPDRFAEVAGRLARAHSASIALFGSDSERALCGQVADSIPGAPPVHNFAGETTLRDFVELAAACRLFLTNDSGAMHIASALGLPTIAIFGATDDTTTGPTGPLARVVRELVECSPCLLRACPIDHRCMTRVAGDRVVRTADELWRETAN